jgi:hypothetical protein
VWSLIGVSAWSVGSKRGLAVGVAGWGGVLMAIVLLKLLVVDRQYMGQTCRANRGPFVAVGLLCIIRGLHSRRRRPSRPVGGGSSRFIVNIHEGGTDRHQGRCSRHMLRYAAAAAPVDDYGYRWRVGREGESRGGRTGEA